MRNAKLLIAGLALLLTLSLIGAPAKAQAAGPTFVYVVTAVDVNNFESIFSIQASITFTQGQHVATAKWTAPTVPAGGAAIAGYNVYRSTTAAGPFTKINASLVTGVTYVDTFVPPGAPSGFSVAGS